MTARGWLLALALGAAACSSSDDDRPPPIEARTGPHPLNCAEIQDGAVGEDGRVAVGGVPAACAADGLQCPLGSDASCGGGVLLARCSGLVWTAACPSG